jgi:CRP/FNR family transcriptional regulator, cyclic AMP receptor protein
VTRSAAPSSGAASKAPLPAAAGLLPLSRVSLFDGLPPARIAWLEARLAVVRWIFGTPRPAELVVPDRLFVVREGRLALFERAASGHQVMIAVLDAGAIYSTLGDVEAPGLDALEDLAVSPIPGPALAALVAREPLLARNVAQAFSERVAMLRATAAVLAEMRVEDRLLARVLQLVDSFGTATPTGARLDLGLTHAQWGLLVGAARESVTLAFGRLRARGELVVEGRAITVPWQVVRRRQPGG